MDKVLYDGSGLRLSNGNSVTNLGADAKTADSLTLTGALTSDGVVNTGTVVNSGTTSTSGAGAVGLTGSTHHITTTGTGDALTLADGENGQELFIVYIAEGAGSDTAVLTPSNFANGTTITFNAVNDAVTLKFTNSAWYNKGLVGTAAIA